MLPVIIAKIKYQDRDAVLKLPCKDSRWWAEREWLTEDEDARFYLSAVEPPGLAPLVGLEVNLDELNFLAKSMERFTDLEEAQFLGALQIAKSPTLQDAINLSFNAFVAEHHRHHGPVTGHKFSIGCSDGEKIVGVAIVGRPVSRYLDDGWTLEVNRLCTDGARNACSMLYASAWRVARALGYKRLVTYIMESENGASLRAAG